jgi:hypothetical protein
MYWDLDAGNLATKARTVAPFWALLAEITAPEQAVRLIGHLKDPQTFWRTHPFPTLAADERWFKPFGDYWLGAVWAPTNYMIVRGLHAVGADALAREATARHLDAMAAVLESTGTIWENYRPDDLAPGLPARPDFVGWSGLGPIALLIETILGVELDAPAGTVTWRIPLAECGIEGLPWRGGDLDLVCTADSLRITSTRPLKLVLLSGDSSATHDLAAGEHSLERPL